MLGGQKKRVPRGNGEPSLIPRLSSPASEAECAGRSGAQARGPLRFQPYMPEHAGSSQNVSRVAVRAGRVLNKASTCRVKPVRGLPLRRSSLEGGGSGTRRPVLRGGRHL